MSGIWVSGSLTLSTIEHGLLSRTINSRDNLTFFTCILYCHLICNINPVVYVE